MELAKPSRVAKIALPSLLFLVLGLVGLTLWGPRFPLFDPAPKGNGSFKEVDAIAKQFRDFYRSNDVNLLPQGYVRLEGMGEDGYDGTWIVYYATASHSLVRGGTIMVLDSNGRIDTYFGHHCSSGNGGRATMSASSVNGPYFEKGLESLRADFASEFKHQKTEQVGRGDGDKPPN